MPRLAITPQFMCRPPGFRLVLTWVRWLTPPAGIFRPPGCTIAGLVWNNMQTFAEGVVATLAKAWVRPNCRASHSLATVATTGSANVYNNIHKSGRGVELFLVG